MTDKTPQNKEETPATLARTTDTARDSEPKSRALPQADVLKERFKAGSIPLQTDFADVIDLANMGRKAVGGAEGQTGPANGFTLSSEGRLELKPNAAKGISVDKDGIAVKVNTNNGLKVTSAGIAINDGLGLEFSSTGQLKLKVKKDGGFSGGPGGASVIPGEGVTVGNSGVGVKTGNGVAVNSRGVNIKLAKGTQNNGGGGQGTDGFTSIGSTGGLALSSNGLSVDAGSGIQIDSKGVSIKLAANSGLSADETSGLKIVPEQMFQKGMIMMFSGTSVPSGWALCDGSGGRPDLRNRFVLGASGLGNIGQTNGKTVTGTDTNKQFSVNTDSKTPAVSVKVNGHKLTIAQMPAHNHSIKSAGNEGSGGQALFERDGRNPSYKRSFINTEGSGQEHNHGASGSQSSHYHSVNVVPPYYILAFIIKL
ncbi:hypothetical protein SME22J_02550 [Serratia marcescens]|nr:hypothetical protein SME22J_02550 [Serratia marcescens]